MSHALWASSGLVLHGRQRRPLLRPPDPTAGLLSPVALHRGLSAGGLGAVRPGCPEPAQLGGGRPPPSLTCRRPRGPADASPRPPARPWKCCACAATSVRAWRWGTVSSRAARRWPTRPVFKSVSASFSQLRHRKSKTTVLTNACPLWLMVSET